MIQILFRVLFVFAVLISLQGHAFAGKASPLEPPETSSPRGTLQSFLKATDELSAALKQDDMDSDVIQQYWNRGIRCFDLSEVPPTIVPDVARESVILLREILDRFELPPMEEVPDRDEVMNSNIKHWRLPLTDIMMSKVLEGPDEGEFLFTPDTVARLNDFYDMVNELPYVSGDNQGLYEDYIYASGWMVPDGLIGELPDWMRDDVMGQAAWKWFGFALVLSCMAAVLWATVVASRAWRRSHADNGWGLETLFFPGLGMVACLVSEYLFRVQVNMTGRPLTVTSIVLEAIFFMFAAWGIIGVGNLVIKLIITSRRIKAEALDADVIRLVGRLVSFSLVFVLFFNAGKYFGLPVTAVFASAGIAGMAVAFAARETLSNFFGGVSIFMDRPFRAGDYIVLDSGERGEVMAVGMRSTRLLTRNDVMITVPNAIITSSKVVNQSAPNPHFRVRIPINVEYGSDLDTVEQVLLDIADSHDGVERKPEARIRFRSFGDYAIKLELLVWAAHPEQRGALVNELIKEICKRFAQESIKIPYPVQEIHIQNEKGKAQSDSQED